jgi:hypothetical protein
MSLNDMTRSPFDPLAEAVLGAETPADVVERWTDSAAETTRAGGTSPPLASTRVEQYDLHEVQVRVSTVAGGFLLLNDAFYPGWRAFVDGQERSLVRGDLLFRLVRVPAGEHLVTFLFEPRSLRLGGAISIIAALVALGILAWAIWPAVLRARMRPEAGRSTVGGRQRPAEYDSSRA